MQGTLFAGILETMPKINDVPCKYKSTCGNNVGEMGRGKVCGKCLLKERKEGIRSQIDALRAELKDIENSELLEASEFSEQGQILMAEVHEASVPYATAYSDETLDDYLNAEEPFMEPDESLIDALLIRNEENPNTGLGWVIREIVSSPHLAKRHLRYFAGLERFGGYDHASALVTLYSNHANAPVLWRDARGSKLTADDYAEVIEELYGGEVPRRATQYGSLAGFAEIRHVVDFADFLNSNYDRVDGMTVAEIRHAAETLNAVEGNLSRGDLFELAAKSFE